LYCSKQSEEQHQKHRRLFGFDDLEDENNYGTADTGVYLLYPRKC
jgi:hypothetical protein